MEERTRLVTPQPRLPTCISGRGSACWKTGEIVPEKCTRCQGAAGLWVEDGAEAESAVRGSALASCRGAAAAGSVVPRAAPIIEANGESYRLKESRRRSKKVRRKRQ